MGVRAHYASLLEIVAVRKGMLTVALVRFLSRASPVFVSFVHIRNMYSPLKQSRDYDDGRASKSAINVREKTR
jgi:hypothetical protein